MNILLPQLIKACLGAAIAMTSISDSAAAGGSGSLFSSEAGIGGALTVDDLPEPEPTDPSLLLYATSAREKNSTPAEEEIWIDPADYDDMVSYNPDTGL